jgi:methionyl-tRNA synthetase
MLMAAELEPPRMVFGHGFVYLKGEKISKTLGNIVEPMEIITKFNAEAFRYYFLRECPFPGDGEFSWQRFADVYNADLANNLGNLYSRVVTLITKNYGGVLDGTAGQTPQTIQADLKVTVQQVQTEIEACRFNVALEKIWRQINDPANQFADRNEPWKLVKTDKAAAAKVLFALLETLRVVSILLKPFLPRSAETIYRSFNFQVPWEQVRCEQTFERPAQIDDIRVLATLDGGKVKPLFPRIA